MNFGKCTKQQQYYGTWLLYYNVTEQRLGSRDKLVFWLDTRGMSPVNTSTFGEVEPADFPIRQRWSPQLDRTPYRETSGWYWIQVDGRRISTCKDLKDSGKHTPTNSVYSLKGTLNGMIKPAKGRYKIEIVKYCAPSAIGCSAIPDPAKVFVNAAGHVAYAFWNVGQSLIVNGTRVKDHAWCPVQTAIILR
ncbi:hypothetical protein HXX76_015276 [Chlamydomonas incerta]|uniref:Uncharacterized protein n=1 Tax=Chlamydomonas incerta TaxID=51695 RepID=A0A835SJI4_CHLIN|nr:hypothetical protein HXX76_015276 [Chlamydomonas incerta]|eukprot:KAG2423529.1 hypothetical protein HXX76_015276 [Chlamydomonas incerta]